MERYATITKEINKLCGNSKCSDAYIYACLFSTIDYKTGKSKYNQDTIRKKFDIPESTLKDSIKRLEEVGLLKIQRRNYKKNNNYIRKNYYYMNPDPINFFFLLNSYFPLDIDRKIKGFILVIKTICLNNTNTYFTKKPINSTINKTELSNLLGLERKTIDKYLKLGVESNLIEVIGDKIIVIDKYFPLNISNTRYSEIRKTIQDICIRNNAEIPIMKDEDIKRIYFYYPNSELDLEKTGDVIFIENESLKYTLENRIKKLPKTFSIKYLFKILNIPDKPYKEPIRREPILIV